MEQDKVMCNYAICAKILLFNITLKHLVKRMLHSFALIHKNFKDIIALEYVEGICLANRNGRFAKTIDASISVLISTAL